MSSHRPVRTFAAVLLLAGAAGATTAAAIARAGAATGRAAAAQPDPTPILEAQREAMKALARMDGTWRGTARTMMPTGEWETLTQTERVGTFLDGTVRVIEGKGYLEDGTVGFNALGVISYDPASKSYAMRSYAMGRKGDYPVEATENGFGWRIEQPGFLIEYSATLEDETWTEIGERVLPDGRRMKFFEMTLERLGDCDWPAAGAVPRTA